MPVTEWKLFDGDVPFVSTPEFHEHRERAPHLEQPYHQERLHTAAGMLRRTAKYAGTLSDLGCGDGGLLSLVQDAFHRAWGYDFAPANRQGWKERGVDAAYLDVFGADRDNVLLGGAVAMTEVLEHLADPHGVLEWVHGNGSYLVCSSPVNENAGAHDECHAWAWDYDGYEALVAGAGYKVTEHVTAGPFQLILALPW